MIQNAYIHLIRECFNLLPVCVTRSPDQKQIEIDFSALNTYRWKRQSINPSELPEALVSVLNQTKIAKFNDAHCSISADLPFSEFKPFLDSLETFVQMIANENLESAEYWGKLNKVVPTGFGDEDLESSKKSLEELYQDDFIVAEKKPLIVDLVKSSGNYLVSIPPKRKAIIDGASQIASLAAGFNDASTRSMPIRTELWDPNFKAKDWDVKQALEKMVQQSTGLPVVRFVNSGAEAIEASFRACQILNPKRRKIIAFEGSFHGRMLMSLHTTFSPPKREPFELYPELVEFNPFPETKNPKEKAPEPDQWLNAWSTKSDAEFQKHIDEFEKQKDALLQREIHCLLHLRSLLKKEERLCVIIEPLQCEGGDKYGTNRFYRALRVLTRAMDTPLIFDEVQTGFGLGGPLFWHEKFNLETPDGKPEKPDVVATAKKAQVALIATHIEHDLPLETSPASFYRGYLYGRRVQSFDAKELEEKIFDQMLILQKTLTEELVQNPRGQGLAFAFDLPNKEILNGLIAARYPSGMMFYPAGEKTARYRVTTTVTDREIVHVFKSIYQCFLKASESKTIWKIPPLEEWINHLPAEHQAYAKEAPEIPLENPWADHWIPEDQKQYEAIDTETWRKIFTTFANEYPQLLVSKTSIDFDLKKLSGFSKAAFWQHYMKHPEFSLLDLIFQSSRAFGFDLILAQDNQIESYIDQIMGTQKDVYEPSRVDPKERVLKVTQDPKSYMIIARDLEDQSLIGFNTAAPMHYFPHVPFVKEDPHLKDENALYSMDQSISPKWHGKGLGFRLKAEQIMEAHRRKASTLRSRNKIPDSDAMAHINQKLGAVEIDRKDAQYQGKGQAAYQSFSFFHKTLERSQEIAFQDNAYGSLRNKITLSNFIGPSLATNLLFFKEILPKKLKHAYVSSGRAEAVDKCVRLFKSQRKYGKIALSIRGDYFGDTAATARSLGGTSEWSYFDWPSLGMDEVESYLENNNPDQILALFVEPMSEKTGIKKDPKDLEKLLTVCRRKKVPVVFHETASMFHNYDPNRFFCANNELTPDAIYFYGGGQFGLVACSDQAFLSKPLQLISTWDGDEHSMNLFRKRVIDSLCTKSN